MARAGRDDRHRRFVLRHAIRAHRRPDWMVLVLVLALGLPALITHGVGTLARRHALDMP